MRFIEENLLDQWRFQTDFRRKSAWEAGKYVVGESAAVVLGVGVVVVLLLSVFLCSEEVMDRGRSYRVSLG
jgi:hypothetical protein